jgi:hypothetical protein
MSKVSEFFLFPCNHGPIKLAHCTQKKKERKKERKKASMMIVEHNYKHFAGN